MRLKATEMVGVQVTSREAERLLDTVAEGKLGPVDDPELVALARKLKVMYQVAIEVEKRMRPGPTLRMAEEPAAAGESRTVSQQRPNRPRRRQ